MSESTADHFLIKLKDVILLLISVGAIASWLLGMTTVPPRVEANEDNIKEIKVYMMTNEVFVNGLKKDIDAMRNDLVEIKQILKRTAPYERKEF